MCFIEARAKSPNQARASIVGTAAANGRRNGAAALSDLCGLACCAHGPRPSLRLRLRSGNAAALVCEARARAQGKALAALVPARATLVLAWRTRRRRRTRMHRRRRRTRERLPVALCNHAKPLFAMRREGLGVRRKQAPVGELSAMKGKARWACLRPEQAARARPSVALRNHAKPLWPCDGKGLACVESESKRRWVSSVQ